MCNFTRLFRRLGFKYFAESLPTSLVVRAFGSTSVFVCSRGKGKSERGSLAIGGSKGGGRDERPLPVQIFFIFMHRLAPPPLGLAPLPLGNPRSPTASGPGQHIGGGEGRQRENPSPGHPVEGRGSVGPDHPFREGGGEGISFLFFDIVSVFRSILLFNVISQ